jgi:hypothetical protein
LATSAPVTVPFLMRLLWITFVAIFALVTAPRWIDRVSTELRGSAVAAYAVPLSARTKANVAVTSA